MNKLTTEELAFIHSKLGKYPITYTEIYNEISDHVISAIEAARNNSDTRHIEAIYNDVIAEHFPADQSIQKIVIRYVFAYNRKITKMMRANFVHYLNWQALIFIAAMLITGFYLPRTINMEFILGLLLVIVVFIPQFYVLTKIPRHKKISLKEIRASFATGVAIKQSLSASYVQSRTRNLMLVLLFNLLVMRPAAKMWHLQFFNPIYLHPAFYMLLLAACGIYSLSCMRLCRQQFKIAI